MTRKVRFTTGLLLLSVIGSLLAASPVAAQVELAGRWSDQSGHAFTSKQLKGKITLVTLAYTTCRTLCPMVGERVRAIDEALLKKNIKTQIVLVSIDPENETPETLSLWLKSRRLNRDRWFFIKGGLKETQALAGLVGQGFSEHKTPEHIAHTSTMAIIDANGNLKSTIELMLDEPKAIVEQITTAIAKN